MRFKNRLFWGRFLQRRKRFFADFELADGKRVVAHCANPGSMKSCLVEGSSGWLSRSDNPKRKLEYTWEIAQIGRIRVFVNPLRANDVVHAALQARVIPELARYRILEREVRVGHSSRIDFVLTGGNRRCFVEVKNVTLGLGGGRSAFPDSVTERGLKHLNELSRIRRSGQRAVLLFCASRSDAKSVEPADSIDPAYGKALRKAARSGVQILAYRARITTREVRLVERLPVLL